MVMDTTVPVAMRVAGAGERRRLLYSAESSPVFRSPLSTQAITRFRPFQVRDGDWTVAAHPAVVAGLSRNAFSPDA